MQFQSRRSGFLQQRNIQLPRVPAGRCVNVDMSDAMDVIALSVNTQTYGAETMNENAIEGVDMIYLIRTMTWEHFFAEKSIEIARQAVRYFDFPSALNKKDPGIITCMRFCPSLMERCSNSVTKVLSIGYSSGLVIVFNIESCIGVTAFQFDSNQTVQSTAWQNVEWRSSSSPTFNPNRTDPMKVWRWDGMRQMHRSCHKIGCRNNSEENARNNFTIASNGASSNTLRTKNDDRDFTLDISGILHLVLFKTPGADDRSVEILQQYCLCAYAFGVQPLFRISLDPLFSSFRATRTLSLTHVRSLLISGSTPLALFFDVGDSLNSHDMSFKSDSSNDFLSFGMISIFDNSNNLALLQSSAASQLQLFNELERCEEIVLSCCRKWKDSCKVILPKLELMYTLLQSYELDESLSRPLDFLFSTALCGLWHPAASSIYEQHWNAQSLNRLRSAVDSASRFIVSTLHMSLGAAANNILGICRELAAQYSIMNEILPHGDRVESEIGSLNDVLKELTLISGAFVKHVDAAAAEARRARDNMLLYVQFIQDCCNLSGEQHIVVDEVNSDAVIENTEKVEKAALSTSIKKTTENWQKYQRMFDPRLELRASWSRKNCHMDLTYGPQAEHVTGTHLYAFLAGIVHHSSSVDEPQTWPNHLSDVGIFSENDSVKSHLLPTPLIVRIRKMKSCVTQLTRACSESNSKNILNNLKLQDRIDAQVTIHDESKSCWRWFGRNCGFWPALHADCTYLRRTYINCRDISRNFNVDPTPRSIVVDNAAVTARVEMYSTGTSNSDVLYVSITNDYEDKLTGTLSRSSQGTYVSKIRLKNLMDRKFSSGKSISAVKSVHLSQMKFFVRTHPSVQQLSLENCYPTSITVTRSKDDSLQLVKEDVQLICIVIVAYVDTSFSDSIVMVQIDLNNLLFETGGDFIVSDERNFEWSDDIFLESVCKTRLLPFKVECGVSTSSTRDISRSITALHCQGERGVVLILHESGKLLVIDLMEADEEEDSEEEQQTSS